MLILLNGLSHTPEAEWNLAGSLPLHPVLKYGIDIPPAKMVILPESYLLGQILLFNVFALIPLNFGPQDSSFSLTNSDV